MNMNVIIMAGGLGKRMNSTLPKVLHKVNHKPMIVHVFESALQLNPSNIYIIVGKYKDIIKEEMKKYVDISKIQFVEQKEPLGTGHAVKCVTSLLEENQDVIILSGDVPLIKPSTLQNMINEEANILTTTVGNPLGYGRVMQKNDVLIKIVEEKNCNEYERSINVINAGVYFFKSNALKENITLLSRNDVSGEYYLTEIFEIMNAKNIQVKTHHLPKEFNYEVQGVNTIDELNQINSLSN